MHRRLSSSSRSPRRTAAEDSPNCLFCGRGNCSCNTEPCTLALPCLLGNLSIAAETAIDVSEEDDSELEEEKLDMSSEDMKKFIAAQNEAMVKLLGGKIDGVAERVEVLETGQKSLNDRVAALEINSHVGQTTGTKRSADDASTSAGSEQVKPADRIHIKRLCTFEPRVLNGWDDHKCTALMKQIVEKCPSKYHNYFEHVHTSENMLNTDRFDIRVLDTYHSQSLARIFNAILKEIFKVELAKGDQIPFALVQPPPSIVAANQLYGKVKKYLTENGQRLVEAEVSLECSWQPDYLLSAIAVKGSQSSEDYVGTVAGGVLVVDPQFATKYFKTSPEEASRRIRAYRSQRR